MTARNSYPVWRAEFAEFGRLNALVDALVDLPKEDPQYGHPNDELDAKCSWIGKKWINGVFAGTLFTASHATRKALAAEIDPNLSIEDCIYDLKFVHALLSNIIDSPEFDSVARGMGRARTELRARLSKRSYVHDAALLAHGMFLDGHADHPRS